MYIVEFEITNLNLVPNMKSYTDPAWLSLTNERKFVD